jgi:hypothetical protein
MKKKEVKKLIDKEIKKALQQPEDSAEQEMKGESGEKKVTMERVAVASGKDLHPRFDGRAGA